MKRLVIATLLTVAIVTTLLVVLFIQHGYISFA